jgi:hypothetical protein
MKKILVLLGIGSVLFAACSNEKDRYVDLRTGETIKVEKDPQTGVWINTETKKPVYIYVDTRKNDTIYGKTGATINGRVVKRDDVYWYDDDDEYKAKYVEVNTQGNGDFEKKVEKDGDIKIKDGDKKIKIDGETGERKEKND